MLTRALQLGLALISLCAPFALRAQIAPPTDETPAKDMRESIVRIDVTVKDAYSRQETRPMPITIYRPAGDGPHPLIVFNHGRPTANRRAAQGRFQPEHAARYLVAKGFVVFVPMRVGYWESYGPFDPEYSGLCNNMDVETPSNAALDQVLAAVEYAKTQPYVDASRWIVAGQSAGGLAAVETAGRNPRGLLGGINFAGGIGGNPDTSPGRPCSPWRIERHWADLARKSTVPMLWLYWQNDKYWGEQNPKDWHKAWLNGGAKADFRSFPPAGTDGHSGMTIDMDAWLPVVDEFLGKLGFSKPAIVSRSPPSGFADLSDTAKLPSGTQGKTSYAKFLATPAPRAFAVGQRGAWGLATGDYATGKAIGYCMRSGQQCKLYAVDNDVVWRPD